MIKVNGEEVIVNHFSDGTQRLSGVLKTIPEDATNFMIVWNYECDEELVTLQFIVMHIRDAYTKCERIDLVMPYTPNARMDRIEMKNEVFTMKHFASIINNLNFDAVYVWDAHSRVTPALLDKCVDIDVTSNIQYVLSGLRNSQGALDNVVLFFPDKGSMDRYYGKVKAMGLDVKAVYGVKHRDWQTAQIDSYNIVAGIGENTNTVLLNKKVVVIDDIISSGGTIEMAMEKFRSNGVESVYIYCTHFENNQSTVERLSKWSRYDGKSSMDKILRRIFTTDSVFRLSDVESIHKELFDVIKCVEFGFEKNH